MVRFEVEGGVDPLLLVRLEKGDAVATESNAMVAMDRSLTLKGKTRGGFFGSIARKFLNEETFFQQWVEAEDEPGEVMLAPNLPGDVRILDVGDRQYCLSDGAFLASMSEVGITTKAQGLGRALFGGNGGFFIMATEGRGRVAVSGFGSIREIEVTEDRPINVDNGHLVAWDASLDYELTLNTSRSGLLGKLVQSQITGEGVALKFQGTGKVLVCSRNKGSFLDWILSSRPTEKAAQNNE